MRWILLVATALALAAAPAAADQAPWLGPAWQVRRVVDVTVKPSSGPDEEVAVCDFYSGGLTKPDGGDIRVAARGSRLVPHQVLQVGPGDLVRVAFAASPSDERYTIYYGNPGAEPPEPWAPKRGVLLTARKWAGGGMQTLDQVRRAWAKAEPLGADFVTQPMLGFNPFGESEMPCAYHFVGYFTVQAAGTYDFAITSDGASWFLVDGNEVVSWPGAHAVIGEARYTKPATLAQGVHQLDCWYVNPGGRMTVVVAWRPAGQGGYQAIPPKVFLPAYQAKLVEKDVREQQPIADFFPRHAGETWWPDHYGIRMKFQDLSTGVSLRQGGRFEWDFGDGQKSADPSPDHVYLADGTYTVSLAVSQAGASDTFRTKVRVERDWWRQTDANVEPRRRYAEAVAGYDFPALDTANLSLAVSLLGDTEMKPALIQAASALLARKDVDEAGFHRTGLALGRALRDLGRPQDALKEYRTVEDKVRSPAWKAAVAIEIAETLLRDLHDWKGAEAEYDRILQSYASIPGRVVRLAHIGIGDIRRHEGKSQEARKAYAKAAEIEVGQRSPEQEAVRIGTLARYVEEYTRLREWEWAFKSLDDWAWEFPLEKLKGHWSCLKAGALVAKGDREGALAEAGDLLASNPASAYAVRLLILSADCQAALGRKEQARLLLQTAVEDYPEDAYRQEAKNKLDVLGGPVDVNKPPK